MQTETAPMIFDSLARLEEFARERDPGLLATDPSTLETYGRDWTRVHSPNPLAVLLPRSTEQVASCLAFCQSARLAVVPSGGRTGLAAGAVAAHGEVVLSLSRMTRIGAVEPMGATLEVEAGVTTEAVHRHCAESGLLWPVDLASKGSSTIGGNLATNAGGIRVVRYGHARHWATGLVAVTMAGDVLRLRGALHKDNSGPDLTQLLIGSEGIFAVITEATLRLTGRPGESWVVFLAVDNPQQALHLLEFARPEIGFTILAFEYLTQACLEAVVQVQSVQSPFGVPSPGYVLMELEVGSRDRSEGWLERVLERGLARDAVLGQSSSEKLRLWGYRENITESLGHLGLMHKNDIAVPVSTFGRFIAQLEAEIAPHYPGKLFLFGHLGDGNLHINVMKPPGLEAEQFWSECRTVDRMVYQLLGSFGGSISAEHGIGLLKKVALASVRSPVELALLQNLKRAFDPQGLLNPGKVIESSIG